MDASILAGIASAVQTANNLTLTPATGSGGGNGPTPTFASLLGQALQQVAAGSGTLSAADSSGLLALVTENADAGAADTGTDAAVELVAAVLAGGTLIPQAPIPTLPTTGQPATTTDTVSTAPAAPPVTTLPAPITATTTPTTTTAEQVVEAASTTSPPTTPIAIPTPPVQPTSTTTTADTPAAVAAAATRVPAVVAQAPVIADRTQTLPVAPPEVGTGAVRPPVPEAVSVGAPTAVSPSGQSVVQLDVLTGAFTRSPETPVAAVPVGEFADVLDEQRAVEPDATPFTTPQPVATPRGETPAAPTPPLPQTTSPLATQFADALVTHAQVVSRGGTHEFQMRLDPPELGEVKVRLIASGDRIQAEVLVGDDAVKRMIESQLADLRQRLEASGVQVSRFDVNTDAGGAGRQSRSWEGTAAGLFPTARTTAEPSRPRPTATVAGVLDVTA